MTRGRAALLFVLLATPVLAAFWSWRSVAGAIGAPAAVQPKPGRAVLVLVSPMPFETFMRASEARQLARAGGAALMATNENYRSRPADVFTSLGAGAPSSAANRGLLSRTLGAAGVSVCVESTATEGKQGSNMTGDLRAAFPNERCDLAAPSMLTVVGVLSEPQLFNSMRLVPAPAPSELVRTLVMVLSPYPSAAMNRAGDEVTPLAMAEGPGDKLFPSSGRTRTLTSATTRFPGVVANVDVAPTILSFFGLPIPREMDGEPMKVSTAGDPFALHRAHLDQRRIRIPIQLGELAFVVAVGLAGIAALIVLRVRGRVPAWAATSLRALALVAMALMVLLAAAGLLPRLTYAVVLPYLVVGSVTLAALSIVVGPRDALGPFVFLGAVGLAFIVVDLALGGHGLRIPLLGGTMLDGVRYYGLPNAFIAMLLASGLFVAHRLGTPAGLATLFACGLVAGLPQLGADVGASVTLFAAAGLWWQLRSRGRLRTREVLLAAGVTVAGLAVVVLASRFAPGAPTHVTHFVEQSGGRFGSLLRKMGDRLTVGFHQIAAAPAGLLALIGLPAALWLIVAQPRPVESGLCVEAGWRDTLTVLLLASFVAYFANDTGLAAAAPAFLYAMAGVVYPTLLAAPGESPQSAVAAGSHTG